MTFDTFAWMRAIAAAPLPATAKGVAQVLALRSDAFGLCWPSLDTIAADAGLSVAGARLALRELRTSGIVVVASGSKGRVSNRYELQPSTSWRVNPSPRDRSPRNGSPRVVLAPPNPSPRSAQPLTTYQDNPSPGSKELPIRTTQELPKGIAPASADAPKPKVVQPESMVQPTIPADHVTLQRHYAAAFRRETGSDHVLARGQGSRHGRALQDLLAACRGNLAQACEIIDRALADSWQRSKRPELWNIVADVNKFRGEQRAIVPARGAPGSNFERQRARVERLAREEQEAKNAAQ